MVPMEPLQNIYAVLGILLLLLVFLALLVAACLPRERRKAVLQTLRRVYSSRTTIDENSAP